MEIEIISKETIRPSSPTPHRLKFYALNFIDQLMPSGYLPLIFFYPSEVCHVPDDMSERSSMLKVSLSQTLSHYYPLAGRIKDTATIDCNDEGVLFIQARVKYDVEQVMDNPSPQFIEPFFPNNLQWKEMDLGASFLAIQVNYFECGGMAIGVCMSHKIGDIATMTNFIKHWAAIARNAGQELSLPTLNAAFLLPSDVSIGVNAAPKKTTTYRRFVFDTSKISALKAQVFNKVQNPTRVQVVTALIYKRATSALKSSCSGVGKATTLHLAVNLRGRMVPPLPQNAVGNISWVTTATEENGAEEVEFHELVSHLKEALSMFCDRYAKRFGGPEWPSLISECVKNALQDARDRNSVVLNSTSWCRFGMYEADFGWGKPAWVTTAGSGFNNRIILMDWRDGAGIEAIVNLDEHAMAAFERDENLLAYASPIPISH